MNFTFELPNYDLKEIPCKISDGYLEFLKESLSPIEIGFCWDIRNDKDNMEERMKNLWNWLASVYAFFTEDKPIADFPPVNCFIRRYNDDNLMEIFELMNITPVSVNFGELSYGSDVEVWLTIRFSEARKEYNYKHLVEPERNK